MNGLNPACKSGGGRPKCRVSVEEKFPPFFTLASKMILWNLNFYSLFLLLVFSPTTKNISAMRTSSEQEGPDKEASAKEGPGRTGSSEPCTPFNYLEARLYFIANL